MNKSRNGILTVSLILNILLSIALVFMYNKVTTAAGTVPDIPQPERTAETLVLSESDVSGDTLTETEAELEETEPEETTDSTAEPTTTTSESKKTTTTTKKKNSNNITTKSTTTTQKTTTTTTTTTTKSSGDNDGDWVNGWY